MDIRIQRFTGERLDSLRECFDSVARERRYIAFVEAPPVEEFRRYFMENKIRGAVQYLAMDRESSRVVGWCDIIPRRMEGFTHMGKLGVGLHHDYRGQGIGSRLISESLNQARIIGLERVELEVFASNTRAADLYRRLGFEPEGVRRRARKIDGTYDDILFMALFFPPM